MPQTINLTIDLNAPVTGDDVRAAIAAFFRWWVEQLIACLPLSWQDGLRSLTAVPCLDMRETVWALTIAGKEDFVATLDGSKPDEDLRDILGKLFPDGLASSVDVVIAPGSVLTRKITVPIAALSRLRSVVQLQLDRLSPFKGDDVLFDCRLVEAAETAAEDIQVEIVIVPKAAVTTLEQRLRRIGLVPSSFRIGDSGFAVKTGGVPWTRQRQIQALLVFGTILVWAAALWLAPLMRDNEIASLQAEVDSLSPQVVRAERLRQALSRYTLPPDALSANRGRALDVLLSLTHTLPDSVHVGSLSLAKNTLSLSGTAPANVPVQKILMRTDLFEKTHVTGDQQGGRFTFAATLRSHSSTGGRGK